MPKRPKPIVLTVLDGWGYRPQVEGNAIALARKPNYDELVRKFPNTLIHTSGPYVGLPEGQMGNSEVGHLNIGAGRIIHMDITRIDHAISTGAFFKNELLLKAMQRGRERQLHLLGLVSDGGVHSHIEHLFALLRMARENKVERLFVHCFMDGRDTPPNSGIDYLRQLQQKMREYGAGRIATVMGRYYAMDRDNRWERILAQVFAEMNLKNLRVAETEKYAHVTYFFNGGVEKPFAGEERILVPSPKVATYDLKPEMSAAGITDNVVKAIEKGDFDAIVMNFANADMVGHSGKLEAAIKAVETVDACLVRIYQALRPRGGGWIITADHGNAETMIDPETGGPHTYHTTNPVPFVLVTEDDKLQLRSGGSLQDIAPTLLAILGLPQPEEMTGRDLRVASKEQSGGL